MIVICLAKGCDLKLKNLWSSTYFTSCKLEKFSIFISEIDCFIGELGPKFLSLQVSLKVDVTTRYWTQRICNATHSQESVVLFTAACCCLILFQLTGFCRWGSSRIHTLYMVCKQTLFLLGDFRIFIGPSRMTQSWRYIPHCKESIGSRYIYIYIYV